ncbi:hypothetical protein ACB098_02G022700 [Castanea mollissima]|uniref:FAF domain-containing protein n=1 Tax=Castanea mollissima TaxID=60419 RepID=A0A8J4RRV7_9ROSI|nr:hypothetical protein CMV_004429 [Castanea mollissima]
MATIVCQGLQSCLDSHLVEPRTVRLKMPSAKPHFSQPLEFALKSCFLDSNTKELGDNKRHSNIEEINSNKPYTPIDNKTSSNPDLGGWSFLQSLGTTSSQGPKVEKENTTYVHPLAKRSWSMLSEKSLELCTENLGNETGTDINESSIFSLPSWDPSNSKSGNMQQKSCQPLGAKSRKANPLNFPPPLTTISGMESLRFRPHREDGRLIIKAFKAPAKNTYFQAERSHGRLRLSLLKTCPTPSTTNVDMLEKVCNDLASEEEYGKDGLENDMTNEENTHVDEEEGEEEEEEEKVAVVVEENEANDVKEIKGVYLGREEKDDNNVNDCYCEADMGIEKYERQRMCKVGEHHQHDKKRLLTWKPLLVATS